MCLFPFGGGGILVPPNERGRKYGEYLRIAIMLHFSLALFMFLASRWFDAVFDLIAALIGYMSIRQPDAYSIQQLLCYTIFTAMDFFFAIIRLIMYFANVATDVPTTTWVFDMYVGTIIAAPIVYVGCCYLSYQVYQQLRLIVNEIAASEGFGGAAQPYYGGGAGMPAQGGGADMWSHPEAHPAAPGPAATIASFKPFSGQGHRLGGS